MYIYIYIYIFFFTFSVVLFFVNNMQLFGRHCHHLVKHKNYKTCCFGMEISFSFPFMSICVLRWS